MNQECTRYDPCRGTKKLDVIGWGNLGKGRAANNI